MAGLHVFEAGEARDGSEGVSSHRIPGLPAKPRQTYSQEHFEKLKLLVPVGLAHDMFHRVCRRQSECYGICGSDSAKQSLSVSRAPTPTTARDARQPWVAKQVSEVVLRSGRQVARAF